MQVKAHFQKNIIIVAGGSGNRMNSETPKQFHVLGELPILMHSIIAFNQYDPKINIIVVLPKENLIKWQHLIQKYLFSIPHLVAEGGKTRFHSVKNGLKLINNTGITGIHDAARPLVSENTIKNCFESAEKYGCGIPFILPNDSVRIVGKHNSKALNRNALRLIQTPQCFDTKTIQKAYLTRFSKIFTDDASVYEKAGGKVILVEGNVENIKITTPSDMVIAGALIKKLPN